MLQQMLARSALTRTRSPIYTASTSYLKSLRVSFYNQVFVNSIHVKASGPKNVSLSSKVGCDGVELVHNALQNSSSCSCMRSVVLGEGTKADIAMWCEKEGPEHAVGIQVKTTATSASPPSANFRHYYFNKTHQYQHMAVVCVVLDEKRCWLINGNDLTCLVHGRLTICKTGKWSKCEVNQSNLGPSLCHRMRTGQYVKQSVSRWDVPVSLQQQIERQALSRMTPFLEHCGITIKAPQVQNTPVDHVWSCEWIDDLRVQQKMSRKMANQFAHLVPTHHRRGGLGGSVVPYEADQFDLLVVAPPLYKVSEEERNVSQYLFVADSIFLREKGVFCDRGAGKKGRLGLCLYYPNMLEGVPTSILRQRRTFAWTTDCMLDTNRANWGNAAENLVEILRNFAERSGRCKK
eukprot:GDKI01041928.1.p1 GENE.GDKI01041928.1~~GDKI01041928.1.p1  ORF type:complete len:405 (-),score=35.50 GDKI01041928.1:202-1416(-)